VEITALNTSYSKDGDDDDDDNDIWYINYIYIF